MKGRGDLSERRVAFRLRTPADYPARMRVAVYTDYTYRRRSGAIYSERAFSLFVAEVAAGLDRVVVLGRLASGEAGARYGIGEDVGFVELPFYESLSNPLAVLRALFGSLRAFWSTLDDVDCAWLLGPHPLALCFAFLALLRGRRVVLGVRQDTPRYIRSRRPGRRGLLIGALLLEGLWRGMARRLPVVVVGPDLAARYHAARTRLEIAVSLVHQADIVAPATAHDRVWEEPLRIFTVSRLEAEKNPLLLADVLAALRSEGRDWRLAIAGEGEMRAEIADRLDELGVAEFADLAGYVPIDGGLAEMYREAQVFLHVSWTEGLPQVLIEAFAAGLPVVATDVGGIRAAVGDAALLIPAGDRDAAVRALTRVADDEELRRRLIERGLAYVGERTIEAETSRVARFLGGS